MVRTAPDYSNVRVGQPLHRLDDQAELAARLGSPVTYDRTGSVIWYTDFEHGLQGSEFGVDHPDSKGQLTSNRAYRGSFSCMLNPREVAGSYVNWGRVIHFLQKGPIAVEMSVSTDADPDAIRLTMYYFDGNRVLTGLVHYQTDGGYWKIITKDIPWVTVLEGVELQQGPAAWHPVKLVIDTEKKAYVRLLVANVVVDLTEHKLTDNPSEALGQLEFRVNVYGSETRHAAGYIDSVIVTQNEP